MEYTRRLAFHGMVLFLLCLLMGMGVQSVANPRIGLSAHTGTVLNGLVGAGLTLGGVAVLIASVLAVYGLRGRSADDSPV